MTDLSRGARSRRGGRRPGWLLLSVLLVLAIAASSALVFTERVELLKLAVILSLWAAAIAAFVSVIYRRQSDLDRAKARDLKLVYDLQLDREISARREYELEVESQLRRELASELRAQAAEEVSELRAELAALRNNLEILFDADLSHRPAIEPERTTVRAYSDWQRDSEVTDPGRNIPRFVESTPRQEADDGTESAIIDVPEEPPVPDEPEEQAPVAAEAPEWTPPEPVWTPPQPESAVHAEHPVESGGRHGIRADRDWQPAPAEGQWVPPGAPGSNWVSTNGASAAPEPPPVPPQPVPADPGRGRHFNPAEPVGARWGYQPVAGERPADNIRHAAHPHQEEPVARHGAPGDTRAQSQHGEGHGQSVAELLARLQAGAAPTGGGRRRRRDG